MPIILRAAILCLAVVCAPPLVTAVEKPNVILIVSDDQRPDTIAALGNPIIKTPHLDRLCNEGTRYLSAYTGTSVCAPARSSFFTGLHMGHC